jgi:ribosomal protein S18 acetylase RimI-like enzyme
VGPRLIGIRPYDSAQDEAVLRACIVEIQEHHRALEGWPPGEHIADTYLKWLQERCRAHQGCIFLAEEAGGVAGFVCVLGVVPGDAPDDPGPCAFITDLLVRSGHRRRGVATALLAHAEAYARACGAHTLRLGVLSRNTGAAALYEGAGFREYVRVLTKPLGPTP